MTDGYRGMNPGVREFLTDAKAKAGSEPVEVSVRKLLSYWGAKRRGYWIVDQIGIDLSSMGLTTEPPFTDVWIDASIRLVSEKGGSGTPTVVAAPIVSEEKNSGDVYLRVRSLQSANSGIVSVSPNDTVQRARSLMMRHDYSQLAVLSGERELRGAVSWESLAQAGIRNAEFSLAEATLQPNLVHEDDDLLAQIPRIISSGFVFVQAKDRRIIGIVTTADLSQEFARMANPFFILGEIERGLREIIDQAFSAEELAGIAVPDDATRNVSKADHLTFGEYVRLLENPPNWERLGWDLDRRTFIEALNEIREIRNDVMHFSPDPLDHEGVETLRNFAHWLRKMRLPRS